MHGNDIIKPLLGEESAMHLLISCHLTLLLLSAAQSNAHMSKATEKAADFFCQHFFQNPGKDLKCQCVEL